MSAAEVGWWKIANEDDFSCICNIIPEFLGSLMLYIRKCQANFENFSANWRTKNIYWCSMMEKVDISAYVPYQIACVQKNLSNTEVKKRI